MRHNNYSIISLGKALLYIVFVILSFYAGKIYCTLNKLSVVPSNEVWYRIRPMKQTVEKCVTQCSENW